MIFIHIIYLSIYPASHLSIYLSFYHSLSIYFCLSSFFSFILYFSLTSSHPPSYLSPPLCKCIFLLSIQLFISLSLFCSFFYLPPYLFPSLSLFLSFLIRLSLFVSLHFPPTLCICLSPFSSYPFSISIPLFINLSITN